MALKEIITISYHNNSAVRNSLGLPTYDSYITRAPGGSGPKVLGCLSQDD